MDRRDKLDAAFRDLIATLPVEVGLSDTPGQYPKTPYAILTQSPSPQPYGDMLNPESMREWQYLVKSVGRDHKETAALSSRINTLIVGRDADGAYKTPWAVAGFNIIERCTISEGAIVRGEGPDLFEVNDIYKIEVE